MLADERQYWFFDGVENRARGPYGVGQLAELMEVGVVRADSLVAVVGTEVWVRCDAVVELAGLLPIGKQALGLVMASGYERANDSASDQAAMPTDVHAVLMENRAAFHDAARDNFVPQGEEPEAKLRRLFFKVVGIGAVAAGLCYWLLPSDSIILTLILGFLGVWCVAWAWVIFVLRM